MKIGIVGKSRYIDADAVLTAIEEALHRTDVKGKEQIGVLTCHRIVRTAPTADVVEVRHGEWAVKDLNNSLYESKKAPHCSVCNYMSFIQYDYCPNCGAKMDGEIERDETPIGRVLDGVLCEFDQNGPLRARDAFCSSGERSENGKS